MKVVIISAVLFFLLFQTMGEQTIINHGISLPMYIELIVFKKGFSKFI